MTFKEHFFKQLRWHLESPESRHVDNSLAYYATRSEQAKQADVRFFASHRTPSFAAFPDRNKETLEQWNELFAETYELLEDDFSKDMLVRIACYRMLGHRYVKFPYYTERNQDERTRLAKLTFSGEMNETLKKMLSADEFGVGYAISLFDLEKVGYTAKIYTNREFIYNIVHSNCYRYDHSGIVVDVAEGDVVFDCGACFGDTSVFFALKAGSRGTVFSLEPHPLISLLQRLNIDLNEELRDAIIPVKRAAWNAVGEKISFSLLGPGSTATLDIPERRKVDVVTTTIDYEAASRKLQSVDFIKMDIEGAEYNALHGALGVIAEFRPRLAISLYHSLEDFYRIPQFIKALKLGYRLFLDHHYVNEWESVLYALPAEKRVR